MDDQPMRERTCGHCKGRGYCYDLYGPDPEWCCECGGPGSYMAPVLPVGASVRLGANLASAYRPHLSNTPRTVRHATAAYWLARGLRALAGIEPIRTTRRN